MDPGMNSSSFNEESLFYIDPMKLLPMSRFTNPKKQEAVEAEGVVVAEVVEVAVVVEAAGDVEAAGAVEAVEAVVGADAEDVEAVEEEEEEDGDFNSLQCTLVFIKVVMGILSYYHETFASDRDPVT
eukprot:CAMPEP_0114512812 /NCGR_PEP_ID=MMETSP0109-20121206/15194_1 /TAXON_ID=29199 /ORGANISM="Chlorarachnion reptans, Strain CCCM449" /LENGTH=126 /DNA_ID=CAMNT_0001692559 /DNA_START=381 /DNA_END=762 /DNA_ORIENTATION=+